ncbi:MAG: hypothetical protein WD342_04425 [Verrucomicrobiales bacterium]
MESYEHISPVPPEPEPEQAAEPSPSGPDAEPTSPPEPRQVFSRNSQLAALTVALVFHLILVVWLSMWAISEAKAPPPQIVARPAPAETEEPQDQPRIEKKPVQPAASAQGRPMEIISSLAVSDLAVPEFDATDMEMEPTSLGQPFGASMSFGSAGDGMVSFFGSKANAKKLVFVVDVSRSMSMQGDSGTSRFKLMKEELKKTVGSLPHGIQYQLVFFAGPAWFAGGELKEKDWNSKGPFVWSYKDGSDHRLPQKPLLRATKSQIEKTLEHIDEVTMVGGTDWRAPLKMAMNLEPDVIYFMTDGAIEPDPDMKPLVEDVLDYNREKSGARINAICLMEPDAFDMLQELAEKTRGDLSMVREDGKILRGAELGRLNREK